MTRDGDQVVNDKLQDMVDSNFKFHKQITDNADFAEDFLSWMFERYVRARTNKIASSET